MEEAIAAEGTPAEYKEVFQAWIENMYDADKTKELAEKIIPMVEAAKDKCDCCQDHRRSVSIPGLNAASGSSVVTVRSYDIGVRRSRPRNRQRQGR